MPYLRLNGTRLYYEESGLRGRPTLLFSHGLLWDTRLYEAQIATLSQRFHCVAFDHRGQGRSEAPGRDPIHIEALYQDAAGLIEALQLAPCHFIGLSMGGFVGLRLAARQPHLIRSLSLLATQDGPEDPRAARSHRVLNAVARAGGLPLVVPSVMKTMFGASFLKDPARAELRSLYRDRLRALPRQIHRAVEGVMAREGVTRELTKITCPALVLHGLEDAAIPLARARQMANTLPQATFVEIPQAGHSLTFEAPDQITQALDDFFASLDADT